MRHRKYRYEYWTVNVEADAFDTDNDACQWAIDHVGSDVARTWRIPALWTARVIAEGYYRTIQVRRKSRR